MTDMPPLPASIQDLLDAGREKRRAGISVVAQKTRKAAYAFGNPDKDENFGEETAVAPKPEAKPTDKATLELMQQWSNFTKKYGLKTQDMADAWTAISNKKQTASYAATCQSQLVLHGNIGTPLFRDITMHLDGFLQAIGTAKNVTVSSEERDELRYLLQAANTAHLAAAEAGEQEKHQKRLDHPTPERIRPLYLAWEEFKFQNHIDNDQVTTVWGELSGQPHTTAQCSIQQFNMRMGAYSELFRTIHAAPDAFFAAMERTLGRPLIEGTKAPLTDALAEVAKTARKPANKGASAQR